MQKMFFGAALVLALFVFAVPAAAQDGEYRQQLTKMLDKSGALASADVIMDQLIPAMKQLTAKEIPADFWDSFRAKWNRKTKDKLVEIYVPIYKKHLTLADLKQIVAFYESPVGKKLAAATPSMTSEGMQAGQQLGMEIAREMMQEMQQLGYK